MEEWKDIKGYEGRYQVSNFGNIRSLNFRNTGQTKVLKPNTCDKYSSIIFYQGLKACRYYIHRLVAEAFCHHPDECKEVNHINGNKRDNVATNLEWVTSAENKQHGIKNGLYNNMVETVIKQAKPFIGTEIKTGREVKFYSLKDAHEYMGGNIANISKCLHNKKGSCKGYTFQYLSKGGERECKDMIISILKQRKPKKDLFSTSQLLRGQVF